MNNHYVLQEGQNSRPETINHEEQTNRNIRAILEKKPENREIRNYNHKLRQKTIFIPRGECEIQRSNCQS